jgi:hypothetical protein
MSKRERRASRAHLSQRLGWAVQFIFYAPDPLNPNPEHEWWQLNGDELGEVFHNAFRQADSFQELPDWMQTAILEAEKRHPDPYPRPEPVIAANAVE